MRWEVRMVTGRGDYTLNSDRDEFIKVGVREERLHTDHWMVLAVLRGEGMLRNSRYVVGRTKWPLAASMERPKTEGEAAFASLKGEAEQKNKPKALRNSWISKETCRLADWRAVLQREGWASTREVCKARRNFQRALHEHRRRRVQAAGSNIEGLLATDRVKEAWDHLMQSYRHAQGKHVHPTREGLDQESKVRAELYRCWPPARLKVPILDGVQPKMSPTISFYGMYWKPFIYRRNRTNSQ